MPYPRKLIDRSRLPGHSIGREELVFLCFPLPRRTKRGDDNPRQQRPSVPHDWVSGSTSTHILLLKKCCWNVFEQERPPQRGVACDEAVHHSPSTKAMCWAARSTGAARESLPKLRNPRNLSYHALLCDEKAWEALPDFTAKICRIINDGPFKPWA